ncbi:MAG: GspE/PulE family protein [FCB group bacterium]|jgi:type II secretory ATPase GspE/PulE/Tfp pilus assembly ATPase PilB-like protein|nr:GspE/PulE family protein [FCB group bacterium]
MGRFRIVQSAETPKGIVPLRQLREELPRLLADAQNGAVLAVNAVLEQAALHGASDVHFEPWLEALGVRFRIDGILHDVAALPRTQQDTFIARLKVLARLVGYQRDLPQDGRIDADDAPGGGAMRVSTFPTVNGEKVVVRLLGATQSLMRLDELGFADEIVTGLRGVLSRAQGTLLLTGPSSSGKTTTIYALLQELMVRPGATPNIVTVEDPVEYRLDRIAQTEVRPHAGFTFDAALRAVLRQDPEVIVIGEIRDAETARIAIQAGLTGHLVISTIHSGTAAGVFTRLLDMGIEPFLVASSVMGVLAQRLVRLNCPHCRAPYSPDPALRMRFGIEDAHRQFVKGTGCDACQGIGYRGRTALGELLPVNEAMAEQILSRPRTRVLHDAAVRGGMVEIEREGLRQAEAGATTLEELLRVLPQPEGGL